MPSPTETLEAIRDCTAANASADVDKVAAIILDGLSSQLRRHKRIIERHLQGFPKLADQYAGENDAGPGIADLIRQSAAQREMGRKARAA